jgi:hypothetical protein
MNHLIPPVIKRITVDVTITETAVIKSRNCGT